MRLTGFSRRLVARGLAVSLTAMGLSVLGSQTASAAYCSEDSSVVYSAYGHSAAWFKHDGDKIYVKDSVADGHSAVAVISVQYPDGSGGLYDIVWNRQGSGTTISEAYGTALDECTLVNVSACVGNYSTKKYWDCIAGRPGIA
ncbi:MULTISPECIES: hypothetical protein [unclassified Streptomyces]|uniref:hypothetical protein n=1 Tax=unclassified Streptomyces TaxID=2593676 RepID=UPI0004BE7FA6|nr:MULTISPECIES: hypothetical protein [unclassified Streptomyces]